MSKELKDFMLLLSLATNSQVTLHETDCLIIDKFEDLSKDERALIKLCLNAELSDVLHNAS